MTSFVRVLLAAAVLLGAAAVSEAADADVDRRVRPRIRDPTEERLPGALRRPYGARRGALSGLRQMVTEKVRAAYHSNLNFAHMGENNAILRDFLNRATRDVKVGLDANYGICLWTILMFHGVALGDPHHPLITWTHPGVDSGVRTTPECDINPETDPPDECTLTGGSLLHLVVVGDEVIDVVLMFTSHTEPPATAHGPDQMQLYGTVVTQGLFDCIVAVMRREGFPLDMAAVAYCVSERIENYQLGVPRCLAVVPGGHTFTGPDGRLMVGRRSRRLERRIDNVIVHGPTLACYVFPPAA